MRTGALIILYNPELEAVDKAVNMLAVQVEIICLIDNSSTLLSEHFSQRDNVRYIPLSENLGIAAAQNIGIQYLKESGMDFVLFSDQDSLCNNGLVEKLLSSYYLLEKNNYPVATIGPVPVNKKTGKPYLIKQNIIHHFSLKTESGQSSNFCQMYSIISSFSLTRISVFDKVGLFEEDLFIDGVDNEWGWRAMNKYGLNSYIAKDLKIQHFQGDDTRLPIKKSTPFRSYYQFRNYFILVRRNYTPQFWKHKNAIKYFIKLFAYPLFISPRWAFLKNIIKGCYDGITYNTNGKPL